MGMFDDYEPVADRLEKFWADHPTGRVETSYEWDGTGWVFKAELWRGDDTDGPPAATGYARQELLDEPPPGRSGPNRNAPEWTNPVEVCETSAIGRALANLGYQAKKGPEGRPSREEMDRQARNPDLTNQTKREILAMVGGDKQAAASLWVQCVDDPDVRIATKTAQANILARATKLWDGGGVS